MRLETKWSKVIVHASAFFAPFLVPILFYLLSNEQEVKRLSVQAILFQIVLGVLIFISGILSFLLIGIPFLIIFIAMYYIVPIIGIVKSINEEDWVYPIVGRWV